MGDVQGSNTVSDLGSFSQVREGGFLKKTALDSGPKDHSRVLWGKVGKGTVLPVERPT